jgi:spermidine/putrescine transport system ATP-binding protein
VPKPGQLSLRGLVKRYGDSAAVDGLDLDIRAGEFFSLLGASGCGKTTTLRMIAGFDEPDAGSIVLDGQDLSQVPAHRRPINTVFQSYALFPFLDVSENVAFGLRYQRVGKSDSQRRVHTALELVQMDAFAQRKPHQLSGGQQQRVALARALVLEPTVLLLDEPLGALDAKLRKQLQIELRTLQKTVGTTFVYVTHDQEEALTMSDRLAVLVNGRVEQVGTPSEVYSRPATAYAAGFLGAANLFDATVTRLDDGMVTSRIGPLQITTRATSFSSVGASVSVVIRPERVEVAPASSRVDADSTNLYVGTVSSLMFLGAQTQARVQLDGCTVIAEVANVDGNAPAWLAEGLEVCVHLPTNAAQLLPSDASAARAE